MGFVEAAGLNGKVRVMNRQCDEDYEARTLCGPSKLSLQDMAKRLWKNKRRSSAQFQVKTISKIEPVSGDCKLDSEGKWCEESEDQSSEQTSVHADCDFSDTHNRAVIGRGAHGVVRMSHYNGRAVAVKTMKVPKIANTPSNNRPPESALMHGISHPNIVQIFNVQLIGNDHERTQADSMEDILFSDVSLDGVANTTRSMPHDRYDVVMEYCDRGSLWNAIKKGEFVREDAGRAPNYKKILEVALDVAAGLQHLHRFGIIHGDIKSDNVLLQSCRSSSKGFTAKIGDFGHCRSPNNGHSINTSTLGAVGHMPPELLSEGRLLFRADVFSFAMLLTELVTGRKPFRSMSPMRIIPAIVQGMRPKIPSDCPPGLTELIHRCWDPKWYKRPQFEEIMGSLEEVLSSQED